MDLNKFDLDLSAIPSNPVKITDPGTSVSAVWLNEPPPLGTTIFLRLGNNPILHRFGPNGLFALPICPPETQGIFATFDVATPGQSIEIVMNTSDGGSVPVSP